MRALRVKKKKSFKFSQYDFIETRIRNNNGFIECILIFLTSLYHAGLHLISGKGNFSTYSGLCKSVSRLPFHRRQVSSVVVYA